MKNIKIAGNNICKPGLYALVLCLFLNLSPLVSQQLGFPDAEGFGRYTTGGRNGEVYHVTNLDDDGDGSFREAVSEPNRIVVFDVGGVINITDRIVIHSNITVAGQTAPGGGITIYGNGIAFNSSSGNDIIRYIRIRMGVDGDYGKDAVSISDGTDYLFDHVSISWGRDGTLDINGDDIDNITFQDCIVSQGINNLNHSTGGLMQSGQWSMIRSLYIDNKTRNPKARGTHEFINSVLYNWGTNGYIMGNTSGTSECNMMGNYFIYGPSSSSDTHFTGSTSTFYVYAEDNWVDSDTDGTLDGSLISDYGSATLMSTAFDYPGVNDLMSAQDALAYVIENVGSSLERDAVDKLLISQVESYGTLGSIIDTEEDNDIDNNVGSVDSGTAPTDTDQDGMPDEWEEDNGMDPSSADDDDDDDGDGYTNIEEYLEWIIDNHESATATTDAYSLIEAEDYTSQSGIKTEDCGDDDGGSDVAYIQNGDYIMFSDVNFGDTGASEILVRAASTNSGTINVVLDSTSGTEIGSVDITSTDAWQTYADFTADVSAVSGLHDVYLMFEGDDDDSYLFNVNYFYFTEGEAESSIIVSATADDGSVTLDWITSNIDIQNVQIMRDIDSDPSGRTRIGVASSSATSYTDTDVDNETTYYYWVKIVDTDSNTYNSAVVGATPSDTEGTVTLSATPGNGSVTLNWTTYDVDIRNVQVYRNTESSTSGRTRIGTAGSSATSYTDSDVTNNTTYYYWLKIVDTDIETHNSGVVEATPSSSISSSSSEIYTIGLSDKVVSDENSQSTEVSTYPNPVNDILYLKNASGIVTLYNMTGSVIYNAVVDADTYDICMSKYPAGVYLLIVKGENSFFKQTVVKK